MQIAEIGPIMSEKITAKIMLSEDEILIKDSDFDLKLLQIEFDHLNTFMSSFKDSPTYYRGNRVIIKHPLLNIAALMLNSVASGRMFNLILETDSETAHLFSNCRQITHDFEFEAFYDSVAESAIATPC